ncbi:MAG: helix-hairpin-helix domain-containing protein [candidate division Zixibacteria bacterium]|nr:helix-hairpin-helix domain-containing protein [candidate division Zixibacteria bacterium]
MTEKRIDFFSFTPQEAKAIIFLIVILLIGSGVTLYKKYHPDFAPELLLKENRKTEKKVLEPAKSSNVPENISLKITDKKINLNTATLQELDSLPGIGEELGKRILTYRESKGNFSSIEELKKIKGIGQKTFEKLKNLVTIE